MEDYRHIINRLNRLEIEMNELRQDILKLQRKERITLEEIKERLGHESEGHI